jgi:uncharacterized protein (DUF4415 family)
VKFLFFLWSHLKHFKILYLEVKEKEKIEIAENIIKSMPNVPKIINKGNEAFYYPTTDTVNIPGINNFKSEQMYYGTFVHELIHSTGHQSRLNRSMVGKFGSKPYAKEELIAELGASFLNAESGILYHNINNSAAYLKSWMKRLVDVMSEDNKFFFQASAKAQQAADYILDRDKNGTPKYLKINPKAKQTTVRKKVNKSTTKQTPSVKKQPKLEQLALFGFDGKKQFKTVKEYFNYAMSWCEKNLIGKKYYHPAIKKNVYFTKRGVTHALKNKRTFLKVAIIFDSFELLKKSKLINYKKDYKDRKDILGAYKMLAIHEVNGVKYKVTLTLREGVNGVIYYDHYAITKKSVDSTSPVTSKEDNIVANNTSNVYKDTKKTNPTKKNNKKNLGSIQIDDDLFQVASEKNNIKNTPNTFELDGEIGKLLGKLQRYRLAIVLTGDPHAGKSEFVKQLIDSFINKGLTVGFFDLEQGGLVSKDTRESIDRNISLTNQKKLAVAGEAPEGIDTIKKFADKFDVVAIDSFQKLQIPNTRFDELRIEYPNTIWLIIFQQNGEGGTRGGVTADYDAPVKIKVNKVDQTFINNFAEVEKNRGNQIGLKYNIASKKIKIEEN